MSDDENKDSFLSRWSSRKQKAATDALSTDDGIADVSTPITISSNLGIQLLLLLPTDFVRVEPHEISCRMLSCRPKVRRRLEAEAEAERAEELARQEQSLVTEKDEDSEPVADTQEDSKTNEAAIEDSNLEEGGIETVNDPNSPPGEGGDNETEQDSQLAPLTHAHNNDAEPRQVSALTEKTEQV